MSDKLRFDYWGAYNGQFNNKRTSNWSLMYRSGCGLTAMSLLEASLTRPRRTARRTPTPYAAEAPGAVRMPLS